MNPSLTWKKNHKKAGYQWTPQYEHRAVAAGVQSPMTGIPRPRGSCSRNLHQAHWEWYPHGPELRHQDNIGSTCSTMKARQLDVDGAPKVAVWKTSPRMTSGMRWGSMASAPGASSPMTSHWNTNKALPKWMMPQWTLTLPMNQAQTQMTQWTQSRTMNTLSSLYPGSLDGLERCRWPCWRSRWTPGILRKWRAVPGRPSEMAEIIDLAHLVDWILTLYRNCTLIPIEGNQDKLAPTPAPVSKGCELVPLLLSSFGSFFHTYIHLILALSLRLQGICVECWTKMSTGHFGSSIIQVCHLDRFWKPTTPTLGWHYCDH